MTRNAYIIVKNFGTKEERKGLAAKIREQTLYPAVTEMNGQDTGAVIIKLRMYELAGFFDTMQQNDEFNWIEYTVQFEF
jgi:hypothetical protein